MSSTITGVGSGFDINSWVASLVSAKQTSMLTPLQTKLDGLQDKSSALTSLKSKYSNLQSALQTFTKTVYDSSSDMWANTKITSSNSAFATATSSGNVSAAKIDLEIQQIATPTIAKSVNSLGAVTKENVEQAKFINLANGQAKEGTFSMFLNGKEFDVTIAADDTVADVIDKINSATEGKITASVSDSGIFSIKAVDEQAVLSLGSSADTSNIISALKLHNQVGTNAFESSYAVSTVNTSEALISPESGLAGIKFYDEEGNPTTSGKIFVNGVEFEVNEKTTLNNLISKINGNSDTHVKASFDSLTNKLILTSTETGQNNISLSSEGTNLLNVLGLTTGEAEEEVLAQGSQELGQNAILYVNGNKVISASNTITGESSGVSNLSITVKKPTSEYSKNPDDDKTISLDIEADYTKVKEALTKFVDAYNDVITTTKKMTASDGDIGHDASLNSILSSMRSLTSKISNNEGAFKMLAEIGISTSTSDITKLSIDDSKLTKALQNDFESVKYLLSDGYNAKEDSGIFDSLLSSVNSVLNTESGYFANMSESVQNQIKNMNSRIERANKRITSYETRITAQFNKMDATISALNSQLGTFSSYFA